MEVPRGPSCPHRLARQGEGEPGPPKLTRETTEARGHHAACTRLLRAVTLALRVWGPFMEERPQRLSLAEPDL